MVAYGVENGDGIYFVEVLNGFVQAEALAFPVNIPGYVAKRKCIDLSPAVGGDIRIDIRDELEILVHVIVGAGASVRKMQVTNGKKNMIRLVT